MNGSGSGEDDDDDATITVVLFLSSDQSSGCTKQNFIVDGGIT